MIQNELLHLVGMKDPKDHSRTGEVVDAMNMLRKEPSLPLRLHYGAPQRRSDSTPELEFKGGSRTSVSDRQL